MLSDTQPLEARKLVQGEVALLRAIRSRLLEMIVRRDGSSTPVRLHDRHPGSTSTDGWFEPEKERHPRVMMIDGPRGTGKTSLMLTLAQYCMGAFEPPSALPEQRELPSRSQPDLNREVEALRAELASLGAHVRFLPSIDLHPLPDGVPIYAWLLEAFSRLAQTFDAAPAKSDEWWHRHAEPPRRLTEELRALQHTSIVGWNGHPDGASKGQEEWILDQANQVTSWFRLETEWREFVDRVLAAVRGDRKEDFLLVLPIDDLDLHMKLGRPLLLALRRLYHPRLVFLLTGHYQQLVETVARAYGRDVREDFATLHEALKCGGSNDGTHPRALAAALVNKAIAPALRFPIPELTLEQALSWSDGALFDVWQRLKLPFQTDAVVYTGRRDETRRLEHLGDLATYYRDHGIQTRAEALRFRALQQLVDAWSGPHQGDAAAFLRTWLALDPGETVAPIDERAVVRTILPDAADAELGTDDGLLELRAPRRWELTRDERSIWLSVREVLALDAGLAQPVFHGGGMLSFTSQEGRRGERLPLPDVLPVTTPFQQIEEYTAIRRMLEHADAAARSAEVGTSGKAALTAGELVWRIIARSTESNLNGKWDKPIKQDPLSGLLRRWNELRLRAAPRAVALLAAPEYGLPTWVQLAVLTKVPPAAAFEGERQERLARIVPDPRARSALLARYPMAPWTIRVRRANEEARWWLDVPLVGRLPDATTISTVLTGFGYSGTNALGLGDRSSLGHLVGRPGPDAAPGEVVRALSDYLVEEDFQVDDLRLEHRYVPSGSDASPRWSSRMELLVERLFSWTFVAGGAQPNEIVETIAADLEQETRARPQPRSVASPRPSPDAPPLQLSIGEDLLLSGRVAARRAGRQWASRLGPSAPAGALAAWYGVRQSYQADRDTTTPPCWTFAGPPSILAVSSYVGGTPELQVPLPPLRAWVDLDVLIQRTTRATEHWRGREGDPHAGAHVFLVFAQASVSLLRSFAARLQLPSLPLPDDGEDALSDVAASVAAAIHDLRAAGRRDVKQWASRLWEIAPLALGGLEDAWSEPMMPPRGRLGSRMLSILNEQGPDEISAATGLGTQMALRLIDFRDENGDFLSLDAVRHVPGFGPARVRQIKARAIDLEETDE